MDTKAEEEACRTLLRFKNPKQEPQFTYIARVNFSDTDAMGIVHHSAYVPLFERARIAYLDHTRFPYVFWANKGIHLPVVDLKIHYRSSFVFNDYILTKVSIETQGVRCHIHYACWKVELPQGSAEGSRFDLTAPDTPPATSGSTTHVALGSDGDVKRPSFVLKYFS